MFGVVTMAVHLLPRRPETKQCVILEGHGESSDLGVTVPNYTYMLMPVYPYSLLIRVERVDIFGSDSGGDGGRNWPPPMLCHPLLRLQYCMHAVHGINVQYKR